VIGYIIRRLGVAVIVVLGISVVTFALLHVISSSPGRVILGLHASPRAVAAFNKKNGYDDALYVQYWHYLYQLIHGNLGYSYKLNQTVDSLLKENSLRSAYLSGTSVVLAILIAIPVGIYQAVRRNPIGDYAVTTTAFTLYSMPSFFLGLLLIQAFALGFHIFPAEASQSQSVLSVIADPRAMFLPILTLVALQVASYSVYMRSSALDSLAQDYIRLARAKGLSEQAVLRRHLLRNSILPMITLIGLSIPSLLAGNLLIEYLFNFPGLGLMFVTALQSEDYPTLLAYTLIGGVLTVLGNLIADVAITVADPRIRLS
jgi:peptide/nickel transport system permease protein